MAARLQNWINRNFWDFSGSSDGLPTINGSILQSILSYDTNLTDENITVRSAMRVSPVFTCLTVRRGTVSSLPINVIEEKDKKKTVLIDHPAYYPLAHEPNNYMSSANFIATMMIHMDAWGNAFAHINRDSRNRPKSFDILEPWMVTLSKKEGNLFYTYQGETYPSRDVLHFRWYALDGICGLSPLLENKNTIGMAMKLDRYAALTLGSRPPGILSYEGNLSPELKAENQKEWKSGGRDSVKILSGRWHYDPIMTVPESVQFVASKAANNKAIYGIYQIPPTFAQDYERATFSNAEQSDLVYAKHTVVPLIRIIEQECNMKLFYEREKLNMFIKFNLNGLLRGDLAARAAFYQAMINIGKMTRNEARSLDDENGYEGGDIPLVQGAMVPADQAGIDALRKKMEKEVIPSAKPPLNGKELNKIHHEN